MGSGFQHPLFDDRILDCPIMLLTYTAVCFLFRRVR